MRTARTVLRWTVDQDQQNFRKWWSTLGSNWIFLYCLWKCRALDRKIPEHRSWFIRWLHVMQRWSFVFLHASRTPRFIWPERTQRCLRWSQLIQRELIEFFTNAPQYKNGNIANFVFTMPLEENHTNWVYPLKCDYWHLVSHLLTSKCSKNGVNCKCMGVQSW